MAEVLTWNWRGKKAMRLVIRMRFAAIKALTWNIPSIVRFFFAQKGRFLPLSCPATSVSVTCVQTCSSNLLELLVQAKATVQHAIELNATHLRSSLGTLHPPGWLLPFNFSISRHSFSFPSTTLWKCPPTSCPLSPPPRAFLIVA